MILWLDQVDLKDRPHVGNKAAVLGTLRQAGFPVPDGFCIPWEAGSRDHEDLWREVTRAYERLVYDDGTVAVRSSGVSEDSASASFAGQYETILGVQGVEELRAAIETCRASAHSDRVKVYQGHRGIASPLAVLVQRKVPATVSGVMFTADPVSGDDSQIIIEAVNGSGEPLVSGRVAPVRYYVDEEGYAQRLSSDGPLTPEQCLALARLGRSIKDHLKSEQDIEWAIAGEQIHVLQARPITCNATLPLYDVWTRANIGEVLPGVVTPLTWHVFRATLLNAPSLALTPSEERSAGGGIRRIHGRAYVRLESLLDSFCYLSSVTPSIMRQVLGVNLPPTTSAYTPPHGGAIRLAQGVFLADALGLLPRLAWMTRRTPPIPTAAPENFAGLMAWTARCFRLHLKCTAYAIGSFGLLSHLLDRWMPGEAETLLLQILTGREDLQTAAQGLSLWRLAEQVWQKPMLRQVLEDGSAWPAIAQKLTGVDGGPEFLKGFRVFLEANGARAAGEFELAMPRWREDPSFVLEVLRKFLNTQQTGPLLDDPITRRRCRQETITYIQAALGPAQRWIFNRLLASYSSYTTMRENAKYRLMEGYALLRRVFLDIGTDLAAEGLLDNAEDVFFLTPAEALALIARDGDVQQRRDLIQARKEQHTCWESQIAPSLVVGDGQEVMGSQVEGLTGIGCSPGTAEGFARVLFDTSEAGSLRPGEILVAPHTDPGWTPLFLSCQAVVTEIGGFLSHGATVAREYGIPAVVNVKEATKQIQTGDFIRVDGANGRVTVCRQANDP